MTASAEIAKPIAWYKEPTKDQWLAWWAASLGWTLDAFDFTVFLLIMVPISQEFNVPLTAVTIVFTITLWMRLIGATASGWLADRIGRKKPLMIAILWYSVCNFIAGFAPSFWFLLLFRALLGIGMGAEWPAGAALSMETWPARSRGFMGGLLQGSWGIGFLFSSLAYGLFYSYLGWRGMLWIGILPALSVLYVRSFVKEPEVWVENQRLQREENRHVHTPLFSIFNRDMLANTLTACWWMASGFVTYYSINALFATHLQKDLGLSPAMVATPIAFANLAVFIAGGCWGWLADRIGRRWAMIIPALLAIPVAPLYLLTDNLTLISAGFVLQGMCGGGGMQGLMPTYLSERFPTEVRATASGFCFHQGAIWGGLIAPGLSAIAINYNVGFAIPMLIGTSLGALSFACALLFSPETKGKVLVPDLVVA
jgi:SHS family lactate transporter-like MFS transporter